MVYGSRESTLASFAAAIILAALAPDLSGEWLSVAVLFLIAPIAIVLPFAIASVPAAPSMKVRTALLLSLAGLALHFTVCVGIYAWKIGRTTFDPMTYTIFELEWITRLVALVAVFLIVECVAKFVLRRRLRTSAPSTS